MREDKRTGNPSLELLAFVRSRVAMVEHDFSGGVRGRDDDGARHRAAGKYAMQQAFFYQAEHWVQRRPLVSRAALAYAKANWGDQADKIWNLRRPEIPKVDGQSISKCGLIYEHVFTGWMFRKGIESRLEKRSGTLDAFEIACWLQANFQTAWIDRKEDHVLNRRGYKSDRGETLEDALRAYSECGIEILDPPPTAAAAGVVVKEDLVLESSDEMERPVKGPRAAAYNEFFAECNRILRTPRSAPELTQYDGRHYGVLRPGDEAAGIPRIWMGLNGPRRGETRVPVLTFELPTATAGMEPSAVGWKKLRAVFDGDEWRIDFGKHRKERNRLCRCTRDIGPGFSINGDAVGLRESARQAADELLRLWPILQA